MHSNNAYGQSSQRSVAPHAAWVAPYVTPFALEPYLAYHFAKVGSQTRQSLAGYVAEARERGLPSEALQQLASALGAT
jgi:hypothetical protein